MEVKMERVYCKDCGHLRSIHNIWYNLDTCKKFRELKDGIFLECSPSEINKNNDCKIYERRDK